MGTALAYWAQGLEESNKHTDEWIDGQVDGNSN